MTKRKSTKRALLLSALSLLMCVSMLIGSTFAWFTDSVTSGNNIIKSGNLDVELEYKKVVDGVATEWATVKDETDIFDPNALWEPGRVEVVYLKVSNLGTLELKYQLGVNVIKETLGKTEDGEDIKLSDHLVFKTIELKEEEVGTYTRESAKTAAGIAKGLKDYNGTTTALEVGGEDYVALIVYMPETVGNEANYRGKDIPTIELGINLYATQYTAEEDSFNEFYDKNAWHNAMKVYNEQDLAAALAAGKDIVVIGTITDTTIEPYSETRNVVALYRPVQDATFSGGKVILDNSTANWGFVVDAQNNVNVTVKDTKIVGKQNWNMHNIVAPGSKLTIDNVTVSATGGNGIYVTGGGEAVIENSYVAQDGLNAGAQPWAATAVALSTGSTMTINGGTYVGTTAAVSVFSSGGTVTINGGTFKAPTVLKADAIGEGVVATVVINDGDFDGKIDTSNIYGGGVGVVTINGGNFTNFSAAANAERLVIKGGTFDADPSAYVADGFKAVDNGDGTYIVVPSGLSTVAGYSHLYTDGTNYYIYDAVGLKSANELLCSNSGRYTLGFNRTYNIMADIDATGVVWNAAWLEGSSGNETGMVFEGNGKTISNLSINGSLLNGAAYGAVIQNITFDNALVTSAGHHVGVVWGQVYGDLNLKNVAVKNSSVTGLCNVSALVGATAVDNATITYTGCSVENTTIKATGVFSGVEGDWASDPNGANIYMGRAYGASKLVFDDNVSINNTIIDNETLVDGGIYGYTTLSNGWWAGTGTCDTFTNWNGVSVVTESTTLSDALNTGASKVLLSAGTYTIPSAVANKTVVLEGTGEDTVIDFTKVNTASNASITFRNMHFKGTNANVMNGFGIQGTTGHIAYENCTFDGAVTNEYYGSVSYKDCTFTGIGYITTYAVKSASFENCVFDKADSRAVLVYSHGDNPCVVTLKDCEFKAAEKAYTWNGDWTSAIEVDTTNIPTLGTSVTIEGCTYDANFSGLYRDKSAAGKANAVITVVAE